MVFLKQFHFHLCKGIEDVLFDLALHELGLDFELSEDLLLYFLALYVLLIFAHL